VSEVFLRCSHVLNQCVTQSCYDEKPCGLQVRPKVQIPTLSQLTELSSTFGPASLIYIFKSLCYMMLQVSFVHVLYLLQQQTHHDRLRRCLHHEALIFLSCTHCVVTCKAILGRNAVHVTTQYCFASQLQAGAPRLQFLVLLLRHVQSCPLPKQTDTCFSRACLPCLADTLHKKTAQHGMSHRLDAFMRLPCVQQMCLCIAKRNKQAESFVTSWHCLARLCCNETMHSGDRSVRTG